MGKIIETALTPETKHICADFFAIRSVVAKAAWEYMREEGIPWRDAIKRAWAEAKNRCLGLGVVV